MTDIETLMPGYEAYKDSGVEWIGEIPAHWDVKRLKYIGFLYAGLAGKKGDDFSKIEKKYLSPFLPFTSISNSPVVTNYFQYVYVSKFERQNEVKVKDILFLMSSETIEDIAKCSIYFGDKNPVYLNSFCKGYRVTNSGISPIFLNYLYQSGYYRLYFSKVARGFTRINLKQEHLYNSLVIVPKLTEQIAIATFLDCKTAKIDQTIAIKEKQIRLLKERKQILIQNTVTKGLDPDVPMRDSGVEWIGEIPYHWEVKRLRLIGTTQNGISAGADYFGSGHPFVSYSDVYNYRELPCLVKGLAKSSTRDRYQYSVKRGDVLFTRTSETAEEIAFPSVCMKTIENSTFAGFLIRFRPKPNHLEPGFSKYYFCSNMLRAYFVGEMNLVTRASLSQELLKALPVLLPPQKEQLAIYNHIQIQSAKIDKAITIQEQMIEKLKEYKATLINSAVTGKIKVPQTGEAKAVV